MIYITGDKHREYDDVKAFCERFNTTKDDLLIVLGDNGVNYYGPSRDRLIKRYLQNLPITFMMIRGNHDQRPSRKTCDLVWVEKESYSGYFLVEKDYPDILYAEDGNLYWLNGKLACVIGGAYSVDKYYRLEMQALGHKGWRWFYDEQLTTTEREQIDKKIDYAVGEAGEKISYFLTHTCPLKYKPWDKLLPGLNQDDIDESMEKWFDTIEDRIPYDKWYCGHWHIDRTDNKIRFMFGDIIELT